MIRKKLILPFALSLIVSCGKQEEGRSEGEEDFDPHPTWTDDSTNDFWGKQIDEEVTIRI